MSEINNIPVITNSNSSIPLIQVNGTNPIQVNGTGIQFVQNIRPTNATISPIGVSVIADARVWMREPSQAIPPTVPVTVLAGTPIVNMPGCVKVHKENWDLFSPSN